MSNLAINSIYNYDLSIYSQIISAQRGADKITSQDKYDIAKLLEGIAINKKIENMETLQNMAAYLVSLKTIGVDETDETEETEEIAETDETEETEEAEEEIDESDEPDETDVAQTTDKTAESKNISETVKHFLYKILTKVDSRLSNLEDFDPVAFLVNQGKDGDFSPTFENFRADAAKSYGDAFVDEFNKIPYMFSTDLTNLMKYIGCPNPKLLGKKYVAFVDSVMSGFQNGINTVKEGVRTFVDADLGKNNNKTDIIEPEKNIYTISANDNVTDAAQNCKDLASSTVTTVSDMVDTYRKNLSKIADNIFQTLSLA